MFGGADQSSAAEHEVRERKFRDITSYLVSAGYFRARHPSLSPFDKVVGGMCWCLTQSHMALDVDVVFRGPQVTTGENIRLAESVVAGLRALGCPLALSAHQISGCDWASVHPVVAWLIKTMYECRDHTDAQLRRVSAYRFAKHYDPKELLRAHATTMGGGEGPPPGDALAEGPTPTPTTTMPARQFRYAGDRGSLAMEEAAVFATLLEFGERIIDMDPRALAAGARREDREVEAALARDDVAEKRRTAEEAARAAALQESMTATSTTGFSSAAHVGDMVRTYEAELAAAKRHYDAATAVRPLDDDSADVDRRRAKTASRVEEKRALGLAAVTALREAQGTLARVRAEAEAAHAANEQLRGDLLRLRAAEQTVAPDPATRADLAELRRLIALSEGLEDREATFRADCKAKLKDLKCDLAAASATNTPPETNSDAKQLAEMEAMHAKVLAKDAKIRRVLAKSSRRLALASRLIDDIPTRSEVAQYEKRFIELYAQVATKLDETRKYYELYNALDEIFKLHEREVSILNSIIASFGEAMRSRQSKDTFLAQLEDMKAGLARTLAAKRETLAKATATAQKAHAKHLTLVDDHRAYHANVKDFHDECQKNDRLQAKLLQANKAPT